MRTHVRSKAAPFTVLLSSATLLVVQSYLTAPMADAHVHRSAPPTAENFARLRQCESEGNYGAATRNRYFGAYQFASRTWSSLGFAGQPHQAPPAVQDDAARRLQAKSGWGQWPGCSRKLGLG